MLWIVMFVSILDPGPFLHEIEIVLRYYTENHYNRNAICVYA